MCNGQCAINNDRRIEVQTNGGRTKQIDFQLPMTNKNPKSLS